MQKIQIDLALEGGGARIFGHFALLEALEESGFELRNVVGTSAGAIAASLYLLGIRTHQVALFFNSTVFTKRYADLLKIGQSRDVFSKGRLMWLAYRGKPFVESNVLDSDEHARKSKIADKTSVIENILYDLIEFCYSNGYIEQPNFSIPNVSSNPASKLHILATDLVARKGRDFNRENDREMPVIVAAMAASAKIPLVFTSWKQSPTSTTRESEPAHFVDGGLFANMPLHVLQENAEVESEKHLEKHGEKPDPTPILAAYFKPMQPEQRHLRGEFSDLLDYLRVLVDTMISSKTKILADTEIEGVYKIEVDTNKIGTFDFLGLITAVKEFKNADGEYLKTKSDIKKRLIKIAGEINNDRSPSLQEMKLARAANAALSREAKRSDHLKHSISRIAIVQVPYTSIDSGLMALQEEIQSVVMKGFGEDRTILLKIDQESERFDAVERPEMAIAEETLYTFPFFLSYLRRHAWGVIPYAQHRSIGMAFSNKFPESDVISHSLDLQSRAFSEDNHDQVRKLAYEILMHMTDVRGHHNRNLLVSSGSIMMEFIPLLIRSFSDEYVQRNFAQSISSPNEGMFKSVKRPKVTNDGIEFNFSEKQLEAIDQGNAAFIFDLADRDFVSTALNGFGYSGEAIELKEFFHTLNVPVGIGYSLPLVERLNESTDSESQSKLWQNARKFAIRRLNPHKGDLLRSGIELQAI